jgi:hypothetical protein
LSGFRIELEEIEAVIRRSDLFRNAAVIRHYDVDLYRRLIDGYEFDIYTGRVLLSFTAGYRWRCWGPFLKGDVEYRRIFGLHEELAKNSDLSDQWIRQLSESLAGLD